MRWCEQPSHGTMHRTHRCEQPWCALCGKLTATRMQPEAHVWICCRGARLVSYVQSTAKLEMVKKASTFYFCSVEAHVWGQCKLKRCACRGEGAVVARDVLERVRASLAEVGSHSHQLYGNGYTSYSCSHCMTYLQLHTAHMQIHRQRSAHIAYSCTQKYGAVGKT